MSSVWPEIKGLITKADIHWLGKTLWPNMLSLKQQTVFWMSTFYMRISIVFELWSLVWWIKLYRWTFTHSMCFDQYWLLERIYNFIVLSIISLTLLCGNSSSLNTADRHNCLSLSPPTNSGTSLYLMHPLLCRLV